MTAPALNCWSEPDQQAIREQLNRILKSGPFLQSRRRQRFLEYIVTETLAGRSDRLKGYNIAIEVFDRPSTFDTNVDPIVRMEAARLRDRLREYYENDGQSDSVRIDLPKGTYAPQIELRKALTTDPDRKRTLFIKRSAIFAAAVLLMIAAGLWRSQHGQFGSFLPDRPSIAVLPFETIGADPQWMRFADGITQDIVSDLSHSRDLNVIARNSTEIYKGKLIDTREVARDLNVKYVLQGSIQSLGERIRLTAQLIEAFSGNQLWSERYDRPVEDLFAVQNEVTQRIAATLGGARGPVAEAERRLIRRKPPANLSAFDIYLLAEGSGAAHNSVTKEGLAEAEGLYHKALQLDPQLARAYLGLVAVEAYLIDHRLTASVDEALSKMMEAAEKAVLLDPDDGETHMALGVAYTYHGKREQALAEFDRAEALAPSDADLLLITAWCIFQQGETPRAVRLVERALMLNPHYSEWYNQGLRIVYFFGKQFDKSVQYGLLVKQPLALDYAFLAMAYAYLGRTGEAEAAAASVRKLDLTWNAERYLIEGGGYADAEAELFVEGARKAGLADCVPTDKLKDMPNPTRVKSCDQQRAKIAGRPL